MVEEDRRYTSNHWSLDKRLNISHLIMTASIVAGIFVYALGVEKRINTNSSDILHNKEMLKVKQRYVKEKINGIGRKVDKVSDKVDKILEKVSNGH